MVRPEYDPSSIPGATLENTLPLLTKQQFEAVLRAAEIIKRTMGRHETLSLEAAMGMIFAEAGVRGYAGYEVYIEFQADGELAHTMS